MKPKFLALAGLAIYIVAAAVWVGAQTIQVGPGGIQLPVQVYGTSGPGALPSCTATANVPAMDGQLAYINNQVNPIPAPSAGGVTPQATAASGIHAPVYCDAVLGKWFLLCP